MEKSEEIFFDLNFVILEKFDKVDLSSKVDRSKRLINKWDMIARYWEIFRGAIFDAHRLASFSSSLTDLVV